MCVLTVASVFFKHEGKMAGFNFLCVCVCVYVCVYIYIYIYDVSNKINWVSVNMV